MSFVKATTIDQLPAGQIMTFDLAGKKVLLANANGQFYALENRCPHLGKPLEKSALNGCVLTCPYHKAQFDVSNGRNLRDAQLFFLKMSCKDAKTFGVKVEGKDILVEQP